MTMSWYDPNESRDFQDKGFLLVASDLPVDDLNVPDSAFFHIILSPELSVYEKQVWKKWGKTNHCQVFILSRFGSLERTI